jgi:hypothetical protein
MILKYHLTKNILISFYKNYNITMLKFWLFYSLLFILMSCSNEIKTCTYGNPTAVFNKNMPFIKNYQYENQAQKASEKLEIPDLNLSLEILQSGCDTVQQEFRLVLNGTLNELKTAAETAELLADIFATISELDKTKLTQFMDIAKIIGANAALFQFDQQLNFSHSDRQQTYLLNLMRQPSQTIISLTQILS